MEFLRKPAQDSMGYPLAYHPLGVAKRGHNPKGCNAVWHLYNLIVSNQFTVRVRSAFIKFYRVGQKNRPPTLFCLYYCSIRFRCTNNILCELKFCCAHTEVQTKFICQKFVWNITTESKYPQHHYVTMAKYKSSMCACVYVSNNHLRNSLQIRFAPHPFSWRRSLIDDLSSFVRRILFINKLWMTE